MLVGPDVSVQYRMKGIMTGAVEKEWEYWKTEWMKDRMNEWVILLYGYNVFAQYDKTNDSGYGQLATY